MSFEIIKKWFDCLMKKSNPLTWEIHRIHQFFNRPFFKAVRPIELKQPMNRLTKTELARHLNSNNDQSKNNEQIIFTLLPIIIFGIFILRSIIVLIVDDNSVWCTWLGSIFHLVQLKRRPPEIACLHFVIEHLYYCGWLFLSTKNQHFFRLMISYCQQIYNPFECNEKNRKNLKKLQQNHNHHHFMEIDYKSMNILIKMIKFLFIIQNLFILTALFGNLLSIIGTLFPINPYRNNFHLFHYSYLFYYLHLICFIIIFIIWNYWGSLYASNLYVHFAMIVMIFNFKLYTNIKQLIHIKSRSKIIQNSDKFINHFRRQSNLFTEIRLSNDYFRYYLSYLFIIYLSLFSHVLFVSLNTSSLSTSIFFILVCIYPAVIVLSLCLAVSRLFQKIFNCYKYYQNILAIYQSKILLFQYKLKILSTLDLIEHQTIGFSFIDSTYIQYNTIISIIFITTTLFLQIMNVM